MFKYFDYKRTRKYIDVLDDLVYSYNKSLHSTTGMAPSSIDQSDEPIVFRNIYNATNLKEIFFKNGKTKSKLKIGDSVRKKYDLSSLEKSYHPLWTHMVFKVKKVLHKNKKPQYIIEIGGEEQNRRFYPEELQKVKIDNNTVYEVEKIIKSRTFNGEKQALVKWLNYPSKFNQWIPVTHILNQ
jgi:hypothetical protein